MSRFLVCVLIGVNLLLTLGTARVFAATEASPGEGLSSNMTTNIIETIEDFEAQKDAKCFATATRLENFIYGTPLSDEARFVKIDLQKALILSAWQEASRRAAERKSERVEPQDLRPFLDNVVQYDVLEDGGVRVLLGEVELSIAPNDYRHYSSIAYALRAILAVQQDEMWSQGEPLLPLSKAAVEVLREALDITTLSALAQADKGARAANERELSGQRFSRSWNELISFEVAQSEAPAKSAEGGDLLEKDSPASFQTFHAIMNQKIGSYADYNQIQAERQAELLLSNIQRFYARYGVPPGGLTLPDATGRALAAYLEDVLTQAKARARERGDRLLRAADLSEALQGVAPYTVNDLEDVTFFPRLAPEQQVTLAAYDLDSYRDFGLHWKMLQAILEGQPDLMDMEPDPFAAELIAEGVAQYSVLLFRIAGRLAAQDRAAPFLMGKHIDAARIRALDLSKRNATAPEVVAQAQGLRSAPVANRLASKQGFMREESVDSGIDFEHRSSDWLSRFRHDITEVPPTFSGGGLAAGDVDGDGRDDLLFTGGVGNALYVNTAEGGFTRSPLSDALQFTGRDGLPAEARQPLIADFDNDGDQDILVTLVDSSHRMLENQDGQKLSDVSVRAALGGSGEVAGPATVFDFDGDGLLDIYFCYFGNYIKGHFDRAESDRSVFVGEIPTLVHDNRNAGANRLYRNVGGLQFEEVKNAGVEDPRWCQAVSHTDFDGDGQQDLIVANDFGRNTLLRNQGNGRFEDVSDGLGVDATYHSMNVGLSDLNRDRIPDFYVSNINMMVKDNRYVLPEEGTSQKLGAEELAGVQIVESSMLYISSGEDGRIEHYENSDAAERSNSVGWAWDADFFDFDNDGDDDLYVLNGANEYFNYFSARSDQGDSFDWNMEPNVFYVNEGGALRNRSAESGADFGGNSRSAVFVDADQDGDLDIAINNFEGPAAFFRNELGESGGNWLAVKLEGDPAQGSNRDAIGARILAFSPGNEEVWREVRGGSGYLSMESKIQYIGVGSAEEVDLLIRWPNGAEQSLKGVPVNRRLEVRQGPAEERLGRL